MNVWRFVPPHFSHPVTNMAIDRVMVDIYKKEKMPIFRIYGWKPYGFSIGYSQKAEDVLDIPACIRDGIPFVKRPTGGGIIFHGDEVTYAVVCSTGDINAPRSVRDGYKILCSFILEAYRHYGLEPIFAIDSGQVKKERSSICFSSFEDYDILVNGKKIGGNAQKRSRDIIMQHGSIPLSLDHKPVLKYVKERITLSGQKTISISEAVGRKVMFEEFADVLKESFASIFGAVMEERDLTPEEKEKVEFYERELIQEKNCSL
ncbi:MAG TPA: lipoate--protein ligase family protein [bacterium]|mgnify:FL=1|nr:lipoate--protein ligase family protein [bacterium]HPP30505.1 lipoate--protein ligase family protein [bacterium]